MADDDEALDGDAENEGEEGEDGSGKGGKKKLLMIIVPIVLLIGGGAGAYFMGMLDSVLGVETVVEGEEGEHIEEDGDSDKKKDKKKDKKSKDGEEGYGDEESAFLAIPSMIVNLNTDDGMPRHLRLTIQLELEDASEKAEVEAIIPRVIDQFQTYLRELRLRDLRGSAGIYRLKMELLWRVNQATSPIEVKDVLFQEILIQ